MGQTLKHPDEKVSFEEVQTYDWQNKRSKNLQHDLEKDRLAELSPGLIKDQSNFFPLLGYLIQLQSISSISRARHISYSVLEVQEVGFPWRSLRVLPLGSSMLCTLKVPPSCQ